MNHKVLMICLAWVICVPVQSVAASLPGPLVESDWLAKNLQNVKVLDVRSDIKTFTSKPLYKKDKKTGRLSLVKVAGHIPGAILVDYKKIRADRVINGQKVQKIIPEKSIFEKVIQSAGVNQGDAVVIMSEGVSNLDMTMATRLYWQMKYFGHDNMAILNGGMAGWLEAKQKISSAAVISKPGNWRATTERTELLASSEDVANAIKNKGQLVDTRPLNQYMGIFHKKSYVYAAGHIPSAKSYPNELMTEAKAPARILARDTLQVLMKEMGVDTGKPSIAYCNSGHLASGGWFILHELMGNKSTRLYDGSMHQWTLEKRPVETLKRN